MHCTPFDGERCIKCTRCIRFCDEVSRTGELGLFDRGGHSIVAAFPGKPLDNAYSGNTVDICPVGALIDKNFLYQARVWFAERKETVCTSCSRGCNVTATVQIGTDTAVIPDGTTLTDAQYTAFLAGDLYVNVHTLANSNGEIRGQLTGQGVGGLALLSGAQETPAVSTSASGLATLVVDPATSDIMIAVVTFSGLSANATASHIHQGATGAPGGVIVPLTLGTNIATAPPTAAALSTTQFAALIAGNLYFNVHSTAHTGGEIRGQVRVP